MRDDEQTMYEGDREYADYSDAQPYEYGTQARAERADGDRRVREGRPEGRARSRGAASAPQGGANKASAALGSAAGAVAGVFGGLAEKVRGLNANRAQGRTQIEEDDYLGVGAPCRLCGNPVDHLQSVCPHCGARVRPLYKQAPFWIGVAVLVVVIVILTLSIGSCKAGQAGNSGPAATAASVSATLQAEVTQAEAILDGQASSHEYTRRSAFVLQEATDVANSLLGVQDASTQVLSDAESSLSAALNGLMKTDTSGCEWPYVDDFVADMGAYLGKQIALTGTVSYVDVPADGSLGWSQITLSDGTTLGIGVYASDCQGDLAVDKQVTVYGVLNSDGTTYAFWADKVEVF